ncbi:MAG: amino acid transporter [Actinomycetales bacterium]|nr:amino acid transporter [Actinomycetales bacterium]
MLAPALAGLGLGASLIIAIGAQNVFVLRQGLAREHVGAVVAVCAVSDAVLIAAGVAGLGVLVERWPWASDLARFAGAAFLLVYAVLAARRALRAPVRADGSGSALDVAGSGSPTADGGLDAHAGPGAASSDSGLDARTRPGAPSSDTALVAPPAARTGTLRAAVLTAVALTWLNPHVYLDTVFLLGSVASGYPGATRWAFGAGAAVASIAWFSALGFGSRLLSRFFASPRAWRVLDGVVCVVMLAIAVGLLVG